MVKRKGWRWAKVVEEKPVEKDSDVQNGDDENASEETPDTKTDFLEESLQKIHLSPIINKLEGDKNDTGEGEKEEAKNDADKGNEEDVMEKRPINLTKMVQKQLKKLKMQKNRARSIQSVMYWWEVQVLTWLIMKRIGKLK